MMQFSLKNRLLLLGLLSAFVYAVNFDVGELLVQLGILNGVPHPIVSYLIQIATLSVFYISALWVVGRVREKDREVLVPEILLFALLFRLLLVPADSVLSSDVYRYLWDGKVQVTGKINPYLYTPVDEHLAFLRDQEIYPYINRQEAPTVYPAGAQILFRTLNQVALDSPTEFKAAALAAEALTFLFVFLIIKELGLPRSRILVYAWNPLIVYELFYSGHVESFMLPPLMGFVYLFLRRRPVAAGALLGLAASIKLVPALLLVTIPPNKRLKVALSFFVVFALIYLPYVGAGKAVLGFLPAYFYDPYEIFNPGLIQIALLETAKFMSLPSSSIRFALFVCFLVFLIPVIRRTEEDRAAFIRKCYVVLGGYLLLIYPALHPWYLSTLIPFLCIIPSRAWLYLSLALPLSYLKYLTPEGAMPAWVSLVQFVPLYLILALEYARTQPMNERRRQWYFGTQTPSSTTL